MVKFIPGRGRVESSARPFRAASGPECFLNALAACFLSTPSFLSLASHLNDGADFIFPAAGEMETGICRQAMAMAWLWKLFTIATGIP